MQMRLKTGHPCPGLCACLLVSLFGREVLCGIYVRLVCFLREPWSACAVKAVLGCQGVLRIRFARLFGYLSTDCSVEPRPHARVFHTHSGRCVDTQTDSQHCGFCHNVCERGMQCLQGVCECPVEFRNCSNICIDIRSPQFPPQPHCSTADLPN